MIARKIPLTGPKKKAARPWSKKKPKVTVVWKPVKRKQQAAEPWKPHPLRGYEALK